MAHSFSALSCRSYTFNRTILEWKLSIQLLEDIVINRIENLLIEPFWNGNNQTMSHIQLRDISLLIEPFWNGNYCAFTLPIQYPRNF